MRKLISIFFIFLLPIVTFGADGIDGCSIFTGITGQQRLYHTTYTYGAPPDNTKWIATTSNNGGFNVVTPTKCFREIGPSCTVYDVRTTGSNPPASQIIYMGNYALVVPCPIDNHVPFALVGAAGIGVFILRKRKFGFFG